METDESSGSRQWPLFLWGFSGPSVSPGTSRPEPSHRAEARTQHVGLSNQQTWEQGSERFSLLFRGRPERGVMQTAWNNMIHLALQRKPLTAREMPRDGETQWDAEVVAAPVTLRFSARILRGCIHNSGTGYPERDRKERTQRVFGRSTVKQDYCQRQGKTWEAQWPPITSCPCSSEGLLYPSGTYNGFTNSGPNHSYLFEFDHMGLSWNLKW